MSTLSEIKDAVETVRLTGNKQLALLHCNSSYPSTHAEINLKFMENIKDVTFIKGDFRDSDVFKKILNFFYNKADVVLSDMAENTTGNKELDSYRTGELCLNQMDIENYCN